jgi:hypothetical protein
MLILYTYMNKTYTKWDISICDWYINIIIVLLHVSHSALFHLQTRFRRLDSVSVIRWKPSHLDEIDRESPYRDYLHRREAESGLQNIVLTQERAMDNVETVITTVLKLIQPQIWDSHSGENVQRGSFYCPPASLSLFFSDLLSSGLNSS